MKKLLFCFTVLRDQEVISTIACKTTETRARSFELDVIEKPWGKVRIRAAFFISHRNPAEAVNK